MTAHCQVAIVGGGIVGATLALLLIERAGLRAADICVIEPAPPTPLPAAAPFELRVSAIAPGSRAMLSRLAVWQSLPASRIANYERMVVWHESVPPDSPDVLRFDAAELGEADLGSIVENRCLHAALLARCLALGVVLRQDSLRGLEIDANSALLTCNQDALRAELVVGADGATSTVRALMGIAAATRDYSQRGIVATVRGTQGHAGTAWQRFLATGPLALLPLASGECSIVWSALEARATALLELPPAAFASELTAASAGVLGSLELVSQRVAFPLHRLTAADYIAPRLALVGDAAHVIHPLAGQGVNQGLQDAVALANALAARARGESLGATAPLLRYQRERRAGNALMRSVVDSVDALFTQSGPMGRWVGREALTLVGHSALARRFFFTQAAAGRSSPHR